MHQNPEPLHDIHEYGHDVYSIKLIITNFTKMHGTAPCEINLYIPSLLLPLSNNDVVGNLKVTLTPCYPNAIPEEENTKTSFLGYQMVNGGYVLGVNGYLDNQDTLTLRLTSWNANNGVNDTSAYISSFEEAMNNYDFLKISYSVHELSRDIEEVKDNYR